MGGSGTGSKASAFVPSGLNSFNDDLVDVFFNSTDGFATAITYTPVGGGGKSINAIIEYGQHDLGQGSDALNTEAIMQILVDTTYGIAHVGSGDSVAIGSDTWKVLTALKVDDGLVWQCEISRVNR